MRINFLNPFGTDDYDALIRELLQPTLRPDVELVVSHLDVVPPVPHYYAQKHLVEVEVMRAAVRAQRDGFDAFITGCCYDPGLMQARELVDIPVVGPLEASVTMSRAFGHRYAVVTDMHKAVPEIKDRIRLYGQEANCVGVSHVGWFIEDMLGDPAAVAEDAYSTSIRIMEETGAETVIIGCTIVSGYYELAARTNEKLQELSVLNPNVLALKQAEALADLRRHGQYRISRQGYYQGVERHSEEMARELDEVLFPQG